MNRLLHPDVHLIQESEDGYAAQYRHLRFIVSEAREEDGRRWLHASVSRADKKLPTYHDLKELKRLCVGDNRTAIQVFPPKDRHIDIAGPLGIEVLHLWSCLEGDPIPDFAGGGNSI